MSRKRMPPQRRRNADVPGRKADVDKLADKARLSIKIIGGALVLAFGWLQLKDFPLIPFLESTQIGIVLKVALAFYYLSWVFGTNADVSLQQAAYLRDRHHGNLGWRSVGAICGFAAVAAVLLWVSDDEKRFAAALTAFVLANIVGWYIVVSRVSTIVQMSLLSAGDDFFEIERLRIVQEYISGNWQRIRFLVMLVFVFVGDAIVFFPAMRAATSGAIVSLVSDLKDKEAMLSQVLPVLVFVTFLVVAQGWIWAMRARARMFVSLIDHLQGGYELRPKIGRLSGSATA